MAEQATMDKYILAMNVLIYKSVWKSVHGGIEKYNKNISKEHNFYRNIISKHHYQNIMQGIPYKVYKIDDIYQEDLIKSGLSEDVLSAKKLVIENRGILNEVEEIYDYIKQYVCLRNEGKETNREIQAHETKLYRYILKQKQAYEDTGIGCSETNLRILFRYLIDDEHEAIDYELTQLEKNLDGINFDTLMKNLNNDNRLLKHKEIVSAYYLKLQAILILKKDLEKSYKR
jgi:hypothetical protein